MEEKTLQLAPKYERAIQHWQVHNFPSYPQLSEKWDKYFPNDPEFCLCAKFDLGTSDHIEVGAETGQSKRLKPAELTEESAHQILAIIRAQASTEYGSIQQHQETIDRAPDDEARFWTLRVMAEEMRHGYQMMYLLTNADWSPVTTTSSEDMVEDILSMQIGSHVLGAFNIEYDSYIDNVVFAAIIDRVGKYQLTMQKVCAYKPMASSMPPMLKEEAFHLAAGVIPMRRWAEKAAKGDPFISMDAMQKSVTKWFTRGLEMFGHEKGGETNVRLGIKSMANGPAIDQYAEEVAKMIEDVNKRFVRARLPQVTSERADEIAKKIMGERVAVEGIQCSDLIRLPDRRFFRRRGEPAYQLIGFDGEAFTDVETFLGHLTKHLPSAYCASKDIKHYADTLRQVVSGEIDVKEAQKRSPILTRVGGVCPCSKSVRWVMEAPEENGHAVKTEVSGKK